MDWKLEVVVVPVSDVDRAKHFYVDQVGFDLDVDHRPNEQFRVVQMTPPGSGCSVTVGVGLSKAEPGSVKGLQLVVEDIEAAHAHLVSRGVECSPVRHIVDGEWLDGHGGPWNAFVFFDDPDGNSWAVQEKPAPA
jgi:catechol 2,3-dioxygenase-like lactoylglutathione lyase family enzyme